MTKPYRLHYAPDNASLIVRLTLDEMGLPYETVLVDRGQTEQRSPAYLALNPNGLIPVLETPSGALFETGAILLWLADTHGALAPTPDDPARGAFLKWLFFTSNTLHADLRMTFYPTVYVGDDPEIQTQLRRVLRPRIINHLDVLNTAYAAKPAWLAPNAPTILDFYLACIIRWIALYPAGGVQNWFDLKTTPALKQRLLWLESRPGLGSAQNAEGLGSTPFTAPAPPQPPEGIPT